MIIGVGAIGGGIAARLAQHSNVHSPVPIARGDNARAIMADGMRFRSPDDDTSVPVTVATETSEVELLDDDVLAFASKTHQVHGGVCARSEHVRSSRQARID